MKNGRYSDFPAGRAIYVGSLHEVGQDRVEEGVPPIGSTSTAADRPREPGAWGQEGNATSSYGRAAGWETRAEDW